ncbi:hypothetical protein EZJ49_06820 [Bdellovibrio bacteriovorus]|uniref:hypothetical protein n=1 Tax=Bdellovibrio bacteriovorus TaxID=959 RepID=UPI0021D0B9AB|nr:hypothetical protein [Bdellovibrio bacteriovorus]UXR65958.1 hypothetical protein EZJ49_06820 [Bdellovibrio bacteriovorus]
MENTNCCVCQKPKATLQCGACKEAVCKNCAQFLEEGSFSFLKEVPELLSHGAYCGPCFDAKIVPEMEAYNDTIEAAKNIAVFMKAQSKETRNFSRKEKPLKVADCEDREEALLRLAFMAVKADFNALIDVEISYEKVRAAGSYKTHKWSGTGIPTNYHGRR